MSWHRGQAFGQDLRDRVLSASGTTREVAQRFEVSSAYVRGVRKRQHQGQTTPGAQCNHVPPKLAGLGPLLRQKVSDCCDLTLVKLCEWVWQTHGIKVGQTTMFKFLRNEGLTLKKKTIIASERSRPDIEQSRQEWVERQPELDPQHLIFLDETWTSTNMTPTYGRAPRGERCLAQAPFSKRTTTTLVCALQLQGLVAPMVLEGAINGAAFLAWIKQELAPQLKPGDVVVLDNLKSHKVAGVCEAIEERGAVVMYLPPYSPEFNPIEQVFSKIKTLLRAAGARTIEALHSAIGKLIDNFTPAECRNYFQHCGYCGQSG